MKEKLTIENKWMIAAFVALVINILVLLQQVFAASQTHHLLNSPMVSASLANHIVAAQIYLAIVSALSVMVCFILYRRNKYVFATILIIIVLVIERYFPFMIAL